MSKLISFVFLLFAIFPAIIYSDLVEFGEYENGQINCEEGAEISITTATWKVGSCSCLKKLEMEAACNGSNTFNFVANNDLVGGCETCPTSMSKKLKIEYECKSCEPLQAVRTRKHANSGSRKHVRKSEDVLRISRTYLDIAKLRKYCKPFFRLKQLERETDYTGCPHPAFVIKHIMDLNTNTLHHAELSADERAPLRQNLSNLSANIQSMFYAPDMTYYRRESNKCVFARSADKYDCILTRIRNTIDWRCEFMGREFASHHPSTGYYFEP